MVNFNTVVTSKRNYSVSFKEYLPNSSLKHISKIILTFPIILRLVCLGLNMLKYNNILNS